MRTLFEIENDYITKRNEVENTQEKIEKLSRQIERLKEKKQKLQEKNWWGDTLIRPIMEHVKAKFPNLEWRDKNLVPMGLGCKVSIFAYVNNEAVAYLVFSPADLRKGNICYETGETKKNFGANTIGEVNGFNNVTKIVENIEEILAYVQNQLDNPEKQNL